MNRLAAIARKHGCPEVAKHIIATQYGFNAMEVQEAFVKITEQAKASLEQPRLYMEGVNLLSSQNLDYFSNTHQVRKSHWPLGALSDRESCGCPLHRCLAPDLLPSVHAPRYAVLDPSDVHSQCQRQWLPGHLASCWQ